MSAVRYSTGLEAVPGLDISLSAQEALKELYLFKEQLFYSTPTIRPGNSLRNTVEPLLTLYHLRKTAKRSINHVLKYNA